MRRIVTAWLGALPVFAGGQMLSIPVVPGVSWKAESAFDPLVCFEWDQASPFPIGCPAASLSSPASQGCLSVDITGSPATTMTLHDFEITIETFNEQTAWFYSQGSISYIIANCTIRMQPGAQPITGVYYASDDHFKLNSVPIELEGQVLITSTTGEAGDAFPVSVMDLADFAFPPASGAMRTDVDPDTGERVVVVSLDVGAPFYKPGGRLDVGSGFTVGIGGELVAVATGASCAPSACPADANGDGALTPTDFTAWLNAYNNALPACDQNNDSVCTPTDFTAWLANFHAGC